MRVYSFLLISILTSGFLKGAASANAGGSSTALEAPINEPLSQVVLRASSKVIFERVVQARLFHAGDWTLSGSSQTPITAARTLASLEPSFITGLLRLPDHGELSSAEVEAFATTRNAVLAVKKNSRFDVLINVGDEKSPEVFLERLKEFSTQIHPDAWTFYVAPDMQSISPVVLEEGIAAAHAAGQMVGYDGPLSLIPEGVDYIVIRAWGLKLNRKKIDFLREKQRIPLLVELPTTFGNKASADVISYVDEMDSSDRISLMTQFAENQNSWGYHLAYPIFYPLHPARHAFDVTKDNMLLVSIRSLMARFN